MFGSVKPKFYVGIVFLKHIFFLLFVRKKKNNKYVTKKTYGSLKPYVIIGLWAKF